MGVYELTIFEIYDIVKLMFVMQDQNKFKNKTVFLPEVLFQQMMTHDWVW